MSEFLNSLSGREITYSIDQVGRYSSAVDQANSINYATMAGYYPAGQLRTVMYESNLVTNLFFNNRLQPCRIAVIGTGTAPTSCTDSNKGNVLDAIYDFAQGTADNGNVYKITDNRTSMSGRSVNYDYDALNRIKDA